MLLGLRTVIYPVGKELDKARDWYTQVAGLEPYFVEPFYVGFAIGGFELGLQPEDGASTQGPEPLWGVADAEAAFQRLLQLGATALSPVTEVGEGIKVAAVRDPFGNRLGIIENPHFDPLKVG